MTRGKLPPAEVSALSQEILGAATDIVKLTKQLEDLQKRFA
jgi:hypothetical protein